LASLEGAAIAQLVEHVIRNDGVGGSNPSCGTNQIKDLGGKDHSGSAYPRLKVTK
jgi:hypothetical protein